MKLTPAERWRRYDALHRKERAEKARQYYAEHSEHIKAARQTPQARANALERVRRDEQRHRKERAEKSRRWRAQHAEQVKAQRRTPQARANLAERQKRYHERHKECLRAKSQTPAARAKSAARTKTWRDRHPERSNAVDKRNKEKVRAETFAAYGNVCACCGEMNHRFLCIDHINGGGLKHRRSIKVTGGTAFYRWLKKHKFPADFRLLCFNCNHAVRFGPCPHQIAHMELTA